MIDEKELKPATEENDPKTYEVKLDLGLSERQNEYIADNIMAWLFPTPWNNK
jgi:hypothetical protein